MLCKSKLWNNQPRDVYISILFQVLKDFMVLVKKLYVINGDKNLPNLCSFWDVTEKNLISSLLGTLVNFVQ